LTTIEVRAPSGVCRIHVGEGLGGLGRHIPAGRTVYITDANVFRLYGPSFGPGRTIVLEPVEASKSLAAVERIYGGLLDAGADRSTFVVAVGGGVVCDVAGFAASTYLRGLPFGFAPTTLLAQVDAGIGGKNGVDFRGFKNLVGVFQQPRFVLCDPNVVRTLPARETVNGLAEMMKTAAVGSPGLFEELEQAPEKALGLDPGFIARAVHESLRVKAAVVEADEREAGPRRVLNFGHTLGHALEAAAGLAHGEAVGAGMDFAAELSVREGFLAPADRDRIVRLAGRLGLPTAAGVLEAVEKRDRPLRGQSPLLPAIIEALRRDKKRNGDAVHFVFLEAIGRPLVREMPLARLESAIHDLR
jgi:3-dehydroquinate synthase